LGNGPRTGRRGLDSTRSTGIWGTGGGGGVCVGLVFLLPPKRREAVRDVSSKRVGVIDGSALLSFKAARLERGLIFDIFSPLLVRLSFDKANALLKPDDSCGDSSSSS